MLHSVPIKGGVMGRRHFSSGRKPSQLAKEGCAYSNQRITSMKLRHAAVNP
jgi:hypothetical protein